MFIQERAEAAALGLEEVGDVEQTDEQRKLKLTVTNVSQSKSVQTFVRPSTRGQQHQRVVATLPLGLAARLLNKLSSNVILRI